MAQEAERIGFDSVTLPDRLQMGDLGEDARIRMDRELREMRRNVNRQKEDLRDELSFRRTEEVQKLEGRARAVGRHPRGEKDFWQVAPIISTKSRRVLWISSFPTGQHSVPFRWRAPRARDRSGRSGRPLHDGHAGMCRLP